MRTAGYDVGGAHLKVALVEDGRVVGARQIACPLWQGIEQLDAALEQARDLTAGADCHVVTMTGELTEIFASRHDGVIALVRSLSAALRPDPKFFLGLKGFGDAAKALADTASAASANFLATAKLVAARRPKSLLIDFGSTTTDIIVCDRPQGLTDAERLQTGELVYTGLTRTLVPGIVTRAPVAGQWQTLARDGFASMADVRRILGDLPDGIDLHATTDGRGTSVQESLARFARGFGRDADIAHLAVWQAAAAYIREQQLRSIHDGALQVMSRPGVEISAIVSAGVGADAAAEIAHRIGLPALPLADLIDCAPACRDWVTRCAPAVAVAFLA